MKNLIVLVMMWGSAIALPSPEIRSRNLVVPAGRPEGRITRGRDAREKQFSYQVGLDLEDIGEWHYECGGSLLDHEWVLTAAHCTEDIIKAEVVLGSTDSHAPRVLHEITNKNIIMHKGYNSTTFENDIALIRIPFTNYTEYIQPITLPVLAKSYPKYVGENVTFSGWGSTGDWPENTTNILQFAKFQIVTNEFCQKYYRKTIDSKRICTTNIDGVNICGGDSGGPLVLESNSIQIGILSFGSTNCSGIAPPVYTRVTSYLKWIRSNTGIKPNLLKSTLI